MGLPSARGIVKGKLKKSSRKKESCKKQSRKLMKMSGKEVYITLGIFRIGKE